MCLETTPGAATTGALQPQQPLSKTMASGGCRGESSVSASVSSAEHDATLLVAALDQIEAQRATIEGMLDAELFSLLLV